MCWWQHFLLTALFKLTHVTTMATQSPCHCASLVARNPKVLKVWRCFMSWRSKVNLSPIFWFSLSNRSSQLECFNGLNIKVQLALIVFYSLPSWCSSRGAGGYFNLNLFFQLVVCVIEFLATVTFECEIWTYIWTYIRRGFCAYY